MYEDARVNNHLHTQQLFLLLLAGRFPQMFGVDSWMEALADEGDSCFGAFGSVQAFEVKLEGADNRLCLTLPRYRCDPVEQFGSVVVFDVDLSHEAIVAGFYKLLVEIYNFMSVFVLSFVN